MENFRKLLDRQKNYFATGETIDTNFRLRRLKNLSRAVKQNESEIASALKADLGKSAYESFMTETGMVIDEIDLAYRKLRSWARPKYVATPLKYLPSVSMVYPEPRGVCLIISPWNYPFQLTLSPLIGAIAAGNCVVIKPSEHSPNTSQLIDRMISDMFPEKFIRVVQGKADVSIALLKENFDYIFFTGSTSVGKKVMAAATENLTPVTLELGGKSPCIVDSDVDIDLAAERIIAGKFLNAGQTCIAPDYLLVHESVKKSFVSRMKKAITSFFGDNPKSSPDFGRIIHEDHFDRLKEFLREGNIVMGGNTDRDSLYIAPTLMDNITWENSIMREEIFGPILPIVSYVRLSEIISKINSLPKPLSLYFFSRNRKKCDRVLKEISFGGGCINDTILHVANPHLPFGGVGQSGMGAYHGKHGFDTFSHRKSVMKMPFWFNIALRFPPFKGKLKLLKIIFKLPF